MYGTCQGKRIGLKKEIKELETNTFAPGSTCVPQKVLFTLGFYGTGANKKQMVCH